MDDLWIWLVVEPTPLKNIKVNWDDDIPTIWENKKCSKPPISIGYIYVCLPNDGEINCHCDFTFPCLEGVLYPYTQMKK